MYYTACIIAISLAILATCIVLNFYYRQTKMPGWLRRILLGPLARFFCIGARTAQDQNPDKQQSFTNLVTSGESDQEFSHNVVILKSITPMNSQQNNEIIGENDAKTENHNNGTANAVLKNRKNSQRKNINKPKPTPVSAPFNDNEDDWRRASRVVDRVSMAIGLVMALSTTAGIFLQAPRVRDFILGD